MNSLDKKILIVLVSLIILSSGQSYGQTDGNYDYTKEFIWGFNKNTNGGLIGGFIFKWSKALGERTFRTIGFELMNVKHPKEHRIPGTQGQFIYGKSNYLYSIRAQYGREYILFKKAPQKGVQINWSYAGGPSIGVIAPYYVRNQEGRASQFSHEDFPTHVTISGTGNLFQGLGESSITVGLNAKTSLIFEMGAFKSNVTGFEIGALLEAYPQIVELMPIQDNRAIYVSAFITLFYGKRK